MANLTRYELTIQHGKDGEHVAVYHAMEDGEWVKFEDVKEFLKTPTNSKRVQSLCETCFVVNCKHRDVNRIVYMCNQYSCLRSGTKPVL